MNRYKDRVAIVTGGASGIGRALCEELVQKGAIVFVADIDHAGAERVASDITAGGQHAQAVEVDVAQQEAVANLVASAVHQYGRLDYMFNNAGIALAGEVSDMETSDWQHALNINLWGVIHGTNSAYKVMLHQGSGHIINTASGAGLCPAPMNAAYCTTKYAVVGLSTALRMEAASLGVNVSVVCPGFIRTPIFDSTTYIGINREQALAQTRSFRMMEPSKCAQVILRAVGRNKAIIPVTAETHIAWWFYRIAPAVYDLLGCLLATKYRKLVRGN